MDVHEKIKVMRLFKDLTQEEMAEKLGYASFKAMQNWNAVKLTRLLASWKR
jgi:DNA-binding XRE family transcriptional regulator